MRVRATEAFRAVRHCQIIEVDSGQEFTGDVAGFLLESGCAVERIDVDERKIEDNLVEPARSGPGSAAAKWVAYARARGVEVDDSAKREDIIDLLIERGLIEAES